jgi:hypothetical protein
VIIFNIIDKKTELQFDLDNRPVNLVDMETGEKMKLHPNEVKKTYAESIRKYFDDIALRCSQYAVDFMPVDIEQGLNEVLSTFLIKRQKLY